MSLGEPTSGVCVRVVVHEEGVDVPTVGSPLMAVVAMTDGSEIGKNIARYFWFSLIAKSTNQRALAGNGALYTPTAKLRGKCIGVTVHFEDGASATSLPTDPCRAPHGKVSGIGLAGTQVRPPDNVPHDASLRRLAVLSYDHRLYDFRGALSAYLGIVGTLPERLHDIAAATAAAGADQEGGECSVGNGKGAAATTQTPTPPSFALKSSGGKKKKGAAVSHLIALTRSLASRHDQANWSRAKLQVGSVAVGGAGGAVVGRDAGADDQRKLVGESSSSSSSSSIAAETESVANAVAPSCDSFAREKKEEEAVATAALTRLYDRFMCEVVGPAMCAAGDGGQAPGSSGGSNGSGSGGGGVGSGSEGVGLTNGESRGCGDSSGVAGTATTTTTATSTTTTTMRTVFYQAKPSLRVQPPGSKGIRLHRDAEYGHQCGELNWWLPVTPTFGTNSLQLESQPDQGDFEPLELQGPGKVARFWGNQCRHGTVENTTASSRVSLDFRVVADLDFMHDAPVGRRSDGSQRFRVGGYYRESEPFPVTATLAMNPLGVNSEGKGVKKLGVVGGEVLVGGGDDDGGVDDGGGGGGGGDSVRRRKGPAALPSKRPRQIAAHAVDKVAQQQPTTAAATTTTTATHGAAASACGHGGDNGEDERVSLQAAKRPKNSQQQQLMLNLNQTNLTQKRRHLVFALPMPARTPFSLPPSPSSKEFRPSYGWVVAAALPYLLSHTAPLLDRLSSSSSSSSPTPTSATSTSATPTLAAAAAVASSPSSFLPTVRTLRAVTLSSTGLYRVTSAENTAAAALFSSQAPNDDDAEKERGGGGGSTATKTRKGLKEWKATLLAAIQQRTAHTCMRGGGDDEDDDDAEDGADEGESEVDNAGGGGGGKGRGGTDQGLTCGDLVDVSASKKLEACLGEAARAGVKGNDLFAHQGARAGYTLKHLASRAGHIVDLLLCPVLSSANHHRDPLQEAAAKDYSWLPCAVHRLVLAQPCVQLVSLGGGPGFDAVALALVATFLRGRAPCHQKHQHQPCQQHQHQQQRQQQQRGGGAHSSFALREPTRAERSAVFVHAHVLDFEAGWEPFACAVGRAVNEVLALPLPQEEEGGDGGGGGGAKGDDKGDARGQKQRQGQQVVSVEFGGADITQPMGHASNRDLKAALLRTVGGAPCVVVCAHAVAENASALKRAEGGTNENRQHQQPPNPRNRGADSSDGSGREGDENDASAERTERGDATSAVNGDAEGHANLKDLTTKTTTATTAAGTTTKEVGRFGVFADLCGVLSVGSLLLCTDATHRQWPDLVLAAFASLSPPPPPPSSLSLSSPPPLPPSSSLSPSPSSISPSSSSSSFSSSQPSSSSSPVTFDVAFPQVSGKRGYSLVLHKRPAATTGTSCGGVGCGGRSSGRVVVREFSDLEHVVGPQEWALLCRFKQDSDQHDKRSRRCSSSSSSSSE